MIFQNFRTYQLAKEFYQNCKEINARYHLKDQLLRASLSVVLNLAEGSAKSSTKDRKRFYRVALGSLRESQAILDLLNRNHELKIADSLGAHLYRLCIPKRN